MSDNTKLYVAMPQYNKTSLVLPFMRAVIYAIDSLTPQDRLRGAALRKRRAEGVEPGDNVYERPLVRAGEFFGGRDPFGTLTAEFIFRGEKRELSVYFDCDADGNTFMPGPKVILSLGCWGSSVEILARVAETVCGFGRTVMLDSDCCGGVSHEFPLRYWTRDEDLAFFGTRYYAEPPNVNRDNERTGVSSLIPDKVVVR